MMRRYPAYRDSGAEWLGEVPEGWNIVPPKRLMETRAGSGLIKGQCASEPAEGLFPGYSASGQDVWLEEYDFEGPGLVLSAVGARCGKTFKADGQWGAVANTNCLFPRSGADREFLWYLTNVDDWWEKGGAAQPFVLTNQTLSRPWVFPPLPEQTAIAAFLDRETAKIDALVAEQRRLIDLLREKRQAVISHAVTKGLNPAAPMKPSGVDWLGDVPQGWEVVPVKFQISSIEQGWSPQCDSFPAVEGEWGVLKVGCVNGGEFRHTENKALPSDLEPRLELALRSGDILISRANTRELVGGAALVPADFSTLMICDKLYRLRARYDVIDPAYLVLGLSTPHARYEIELAASGASSSMLNIPQSAVLSMKLPLPPLTEQAAIVDFIRNETEKLGTLTATAETAIALLQERRAALISAAVTGKIDVRDLVATETEAA